MIKVKPSEIAISAFAKSRQFGLNPDDDTRELGGCILTEDEFIADLKHWTNEEGYLELEDGFKEFIKELPIPEHQLVHFIPTFTRAGEGDLLVTIFKPRLDGEAEVAHTYCETDKPSVPPTEGRLILYSTEALLAEGQPTTAGSLYEVVSVNIGPKNEPVPPQTLLRNYYYSRNPDDPRGAGGSPHFKGVEDAEVLSRLIESLEYWERMGRKVKRGKFTAK